MRHLRNIVVIGVVAIAVILGLSLSARAQFMLFGHPLLGKEAPDFTLNSLQGQKVVLSDVLKKGPAILFFWATWCPHCRAQLPALNAAVPEASSQGIEIMAINLEEGPGRVQSYLDRARVNMDVLLDSDAEVAGKYMVVGVPSYFLIGKDGTILSVEHEMPSDYQDILLKE